MTSSEELPDLAVFGIMMRGGDNYHEAADSLLTSWDAASCIDDCVSAATVGDASFNPYNLIPEGTGVFNYRGSLTTPPCWEVVNWNLAEKPMLVSFRQILAVSNLINHYNGQRDSDGQCVSDSTVASIAGLTGRDTQDLLNRTVTKMCAPMTMRTSEGSDAGTQESAPSESSGSSAFTKLPSTSCSLAIFVVASTTLWLF